MASLRRKAKSRKSIAEVEQKTINPLMAQLAPPKLDMKSVAAHASNSRNVMSPRTLISPRSPRGKEKDTTVRSNPIFAYYNDLISASQSSKKIWDILEQKKALRDSQSPPSSTGSPHRSRSASVSLDSAPFAVSNEEVETRERIRAKNRIKSAGPMLLVSMTGGGKVSGIAEWSEKEFAKSVTKQARRSTMVEKQKRLRRAVSNDTLPILNVMNPGVVDRWNSNFVIPKRRRQSRRSKRLSRRSLRASGDKEAGSDDILRPSPLAVSSKEEEVTPVAEADRKGGKRGSKKAKKKKPHSIVSSEDEGGESVEMCTVSVDSVQTRKRSFPSLDNHNSRRHKNRRKRGELKRTRSEGDFNLDNYCGFLRSIKLRPLVGTWVESSSCRADTDHPSEPASHSSTTTPSASSLAPPTATTPINFTLKPSRLRAFSLATVARALGPGSPHDMALGERDGGYQNKAKEPSEESSEEEEPAITEDKREDDENLRWEDKDGRKLITCGSVDRLFQCLADGTLAGPDFLYLFLLTHLYFLDSVSLLNKLRERFEHVEADDNSAKTVIQLRIINVLKKWIENHHYFFETDTALLEAFNQFVDAMDAEGGQTKDWASILRKAQDEHVPLQDRLAPLSALNQRSDEKLRPYLPENIQNDRLTFLDMHPMEIARQMTLIDHGVFVNITPMELFKTAWAKGDKAKAPHVLEMTERFNKVRCCPRMCQWPGMLLGRV
eukprot:TRINITY_DN6518_c0_g1_i2.p1 TRINITY_DN6518_c0_g1~~TRINITY_DN6518_c0_g1_i2.p1  ORF type:complete len:720 (-),score=106.27 TRINITY_DN6518_c0_g1_i2:1031-3190(-)